MNILHLFFKKKQSFKQPNAAIQTLRDKTAIQNERF